MQTKLYTSMLAPVLDLLDFAIIIWEEGNYIETTQVDGQDVSLYKFNQDLFLMWYSKSVIKDITKTNLKEAIKMFPGESIL